MKTLVNFFNAQKLGLFRVLLALIVLVSVTVTPSQKPVLAAGNVCETSSPHPNPQYAVTVCITVPANGAVLTGAASVTATVSITGTNPGVQKLLFYLGGQYLLTDYTSAYSFTLPTTKFVDGNRFLEVEAKLRDGFTSTRAAVSVTFNNGISQPPVNNNNYTISTGSTPQVGRPFILAATGDGASGEPNAGAVTDLIAGWNPNMFLYLGDVYDDGTATEFHNWYGTGTDFYSRFRSITNPAVGNHEYTGTEAPGYFDYWDNVPHYYSYNVAGWHVISLDSTSQYNQSAPGTPQYDWLVQDLNASTAICTIVYFHHPVFNVGAEGYATRMNDIWALMAQKGVDVVLTGHDHDYQRWVPLNGQGVSDPQGITQFVVGTGGHGIQDFILTDSRMAIGFDTPPSAFGSLRMELNQHGTAYQFVNIQGIVLDSGSIKCSGASADTTAPNAPTNLTATSESSTHADLSWTSATDNVGVTGYDIYRNGTLLTTVSAVTSYTDNTVAGGVTYQYQVRARDAAGNVSGLSNIATVTTAALLFSDNFESGNFSKWTSITGLIMQQQEVYQGLYAARQTSTSAATWGYKQLDSTQTNLYYRLRFKIVSMASNVYVLKFRTSTGTSLLGVYVSSTGKLAVRNDVAPTTTTSATNVATGAWHDLQTRVQINGAASQYEVWLDGIHIDALSKTETLGTIPVGRIQLGDNSGARTYDVAMDNVQVNPNLIDGVPPTVGITEPVENAAVRTDVALSADASDNVGVDFVEFLVNGVVVGTDYTAPYHMIWNSKTVSDGTATITARAVDAASNSGISSSRTVTVDNTSPNTTIDSGPSGDGNIDVAAFTFSASEPNVTFDCFLDGEHYEECTSPYTSSNLSGGPHSFQVSAIDAAGNFDSSPASRTWVVDSNAPTSTPTMTLPPTNTPTNTPTFTATPSASTFTFNPVADTYVNAGSASTNYGSSSTLRADASPDLHSYLRFNVQGLNGPVTHATLRVYSNSTLTAGYQTKSVTDNTWVENTVTYANAPAIGGLIGSSGAITANTWTSVDVTSFVTGSGLFSLALTTTSNTSISLASREVIANPPQLIIETQNQGGPTVTPTFTPTPSPISTSTSTPTATPTFGPSPTPTDTPTTTPTATDTPLPSPTPTYTETPTSTPTATPTLVVDPIFSDGFESGNLSAWSSSVINGGDLSVSSSAALTGSNGLQAVINDNNAIYVANDTPNAEPRYRARFYFDPNSIVMADRDAFYLLYGYSGTSTAILRVELRMFKGSYQLRAALRNDGNGWTSSGWTNASDAPQVIELDWRAATGLDLLDGSLALWLDGTQVANITAIDNDTRRIDQIQFGAVSEIDTGTRGTLYFDAFESRRQSYIGP